MSTPQFALTEVAASAVRTQRGPAWLREPLLHFILLGGLLFALHFLVAARADDSRTIVIGADVDKEARDTFSAARGRQPNARELEALRQVWLDNEVLYREGIALEVDRGDIMIRDRVIFKALSIIDASVKLPEVDDQQLRQWFEANRVKYDEPARYSFQEAVLAGENSEAAVREFVAALGAGGPGQIDAGLRVFKDRPHDNLSQSYGAEFATELEQLAPGEWRALRTRDGWRAIQLGSITPAKPAVYEVLRNVVLQDWKDARAAEARTAAVRALGRKYHVRAETDAK
jgi:parvulin-like peptidyl-prolyl cis-trans isomerase-like protein